MGPAVRTVAVQLLDVGRERDHNEDFVGHYIPQDQRQLQMYGALYVVADGMGGHQAGEVASEIATTTAIREYYAPQTGTGPLGNIPERLSRAVRRANTAVYQEAQTNVQRKGMGTTMVAAVVRGAEVHIAWVGDSRAYLLREGKLQQLSEDHSFVQEQVKAGILTPEQARNHPQKNVITRALGHRPEVQVDSKAGPLRPGDRLLLCSDGLSGPVSDPEIARILQQFPINEAVTRLIGAANANGGPDNISATIVEALPLDPAQPLALMIPPVQPVTAPAAGGPAAVPTEPVPGPRPTPASTPPAARGSKRGIIIGAVAVLAFLLIVAGVVWAISGRGQEGDETPQPTLTHTALVPTAVPPGETPDTPGETAEAPEATATPQLAATSTPRPATPTPSDTPTPQATACVPSAPTLLKPDADATFYSGMEITFEWAGGNLCRPGDQWQVSVQGGGAALIFDAGQAQSLTQQVNTAPGPYNWAVQGITPQGEVIAPTQSGGRIINFRVSDETRPTPAPGQPDPCQVHSDTDGIPDCNDDCPNENGPPQNNGCP
jgi:serine/threonine protein phosphatase PrpC